ncbi:MAG: aminotransferase class IV [Acidaminococcaceae bacterium]
MKIWLNGEWTETDGRDNIIGTPAFQFGYGLFETILVRSGSPADFERHIQRLAGSIRQIDHADSTFAVHELMDKAFSALASCKGSKNVLKIVAYKEEASWKTILLLRPYLYTSADYERGFRLIESSSCRNAKSLLVYHKSLNYLENYLERINAKEKGYDDAYFLNTEGFVTECSSANIFVLKNHELFTPPVKEGLLPGVMRAKLLAVANELGLRAQETNVSTELLQNAEMVLVTNALLGAMPVSAIGSQKYFFEPAAIRQINRALGREI